MEILIIDDDSNDRIILGKYLAKCKITKSSIHSVSSINGAEEVLLKKNIDVIFLDLKLENTEGAETFDAVEKIAQEYSSSKPAIIILSGTKNYKMAKELLHKGALKFLSKDGLRPKDLQRCINGVLVQRSLPKRKKFNLF